MSEITAAILNIMMFQAGMILLYTLFLSTDETALSSDDISLIRHSVPVRDHSHISLFTAPRERRRLFYRKEHPDATEMLLQKIVNRMNQDPNVSMQNKADIQKEAFV